MSAWCYWENGEDADLVDRASESIEHALVWNGHSREGEVFVWWFNQSYQWSIAFYCQSWVVRVLQESPCVPQSQVDWGSCCCVSFCHRTISSCLQISDCGWRLHTKPGVQPRWNWTLLEMHAQPHFQLHHFHLHQLWSEAVIELRDFKEAEVSKARQQIVDMALQVGFEEVAKDNVEDLLLSHREE